MDSCIISWLISNQNICCGYSTLCMLGNFTCFCCHLLTFFINNFLLKFFTELKNNFLKKFLRENNHSVKQFLIQIQIRTNRMSVLIWVQTVCKGTELPQARKELDEVSARLFFYFQQLILGGMFF